MQEAERHDRNAQCAWSWRLSPTGYNTGSCYSPVPVTDLPPARSIPRQRQTVNPRTVERTGVLAVLWHDVRQLQVNVGHGRMPSRFKLTSGTRLFDLDGSNRYLATSVGMGAMIAESRNTF